MNGYGFIATIINSIAALAVHDFGIKSANVKRKAKTLVPVPDRQRGIDKMNFCIDWHSLSYIFVLVVC